MFLQLSLAIPKKCPKNDYYSSKIIKKKESGKERSSISSENIIKYNKYKLTHICTWININIIICIKKLYS